MPDIRLTIQPPATHLADWTLTVRGTRMPFAAPERPEWKRFRAWLDSRYNSWSKAQKLASAEDPQSRRETLDWAFAGLSENRRATKDGKHPINASMEARIEWLWRGLNIIDPAFTRDAFEKLIADMPFTEFLSLRPEPTESEGPDADMLADLDDLFDEPVVHDRISIDPKIMFGKPVISGTRIPVDLLLREFAAGLPEAAILAQYPGLTREDFLAAVAYAADCLPGPLEAAAVREP